jgi:hypothetical protein
MNTTTIAAAAAADDDGGGGGVNLLVYQLIKFLISTPTRSSLHEVFVIGALPT